MDCLSPAEMGAVPTCQYPQKAKKCGKDKDRALSHGDLCSSCPSIELRTSERILLQLYATLSGQVNPGPLGTPISLNYLSIDTYLVNMGIHSPWLRNWIFNRLNYLFSKHMSAQLTSAKGK